MVLSKLKTRLVCYLFCSLFSCVPIVAQPSDNALFPIEQNHRWGYIDRSGKVVIEPRFAFADDFSEGLAVVQVDGKWGYIDTSGRIVIEPKYSVARKFSEGLARVQASGEAYSYGGLWGFINRSGQFVIAAQLGELEGVSEDAYDFHDGLAMIQAGGLTGFIDKAGNTVISPRFQYAYPFNEGLATATEGSERKWGYIDTTGAWVVTPRFDSASLFSNGFGPVSLNGTCGYVDKTGELKLIPRFKRAEKDCAAVWGSFDSGLSRWMIGDKYGFINTRGDVVIKPEFDLTFDFAEGMAFVKKNGKYGFVDQTGKLAIEPQFYFARDFRNGLAKVGFAPDGWGYIDKSGHFVWKQNAGPAADEQASGFFQFGHTRDLLFVGWSPDGDLIASYSGADGWIKVWNATTGQLVWNIRANLLKPDAPLKSPDGKLLASGIKSDSFQIREAQSGKVIWTMKASSTSPERVTSPDGSMIAERGRYGDACVNIFDTRSNKLVRRLEGHPGIVHALVFSPDGKIFASGGGDKIVRLWDTQTRVVTRTLSQHTKKITSLAFSRDGKRLISGSEDDTVKIWNVADGSLLRSITTHTSSFDGVATVALNNDGQIAISGGDREIKVWNVATGKELHTLTTNDVRYLAFSPKGNLIVSAHGDGTTKLWDLTTGRLLRVMKGRFEDARVAVFSADGKFIATGYHSGDTRVEVRSVQSGKLVAQLSDDSDYTYSISFSPDGRQLATGDIGGDIKVWNLRTGKVIKTFEQPYSSNDQVAFSRDGKYLISGGENQNIMLWDVPSGGLIWSAVPIDWESEKRASEEAQKEYAIASALEAEKQRKTVAADKEISTWVRPVTITFSHFGEATNPLAQRMMEKGAVEKSLITKSAADANGLWLRLRNDSPLPISFRTDSGYLPRAGCGVKLSDGSNGGGLCDGAEVSIQYQIEEGDGKPVPWGIDVSWESVLPPHTSVLFSVSKAHLENRRTVFVSYTFLKENEKHELDDYGTRRRASFRRQQLRNRR
ncbi:MAG TPA: WG repeat-containing protein [Pyrinomonadaceae bacterium]|nr:WG repeat-containing protein [Pyrinomonadaceae bacterium]